MTTPNGSSTTTKWGQGLSQNDLMEKDTVLVLDDRDNVLGSASKKESHVFSPAQPRAILHRAFSVFLFDKSDGRLLLQQRASTKITFPNVSLGSEPWLACVVLSLFLTNGNDAFFVLFTLFVPTLRFGPIRVVRTPCTAWNPAKWMARPMWQRATPRAPPGANWNTN